jgi:AcrR family transcriptional regulator
MEGQEGKIPDKVKTRNRQVQRTRSWILEALMVLLDEKPYGKIGVLDITEKAGIARQTFYRNFNNKDDIASEYLMNTISFELLKNNESKDEITEYAIVLTFNFKFMLEHRENIKKILSIVDIQHRIRNNAKEFVLEILEQYKTKLSKREYLFCQYKFYYQMIGSLHVFFSWFISDMPLPVGEIISMLNEMNNPYTNQYSNIPNLLVAINEG